MIIELFSLGFRADDYKRIQIESLRFRRGGSLWWKMSGRREHPPSTTCARLDRPVANDSLPLKIFTQRNFAVDFLRKKYTFRGKMVNLRF